MKASNCGYQDQVVKASGRGTIEPELLEHLSECQDCREVAAIASQIQARVAGVEPGSGLSDEAARLWHVSRSLTPAPHWKSMQQRLLLVRSLSAGVPLLAVLVLLRDRLAGATVLADATRILRAGLDSLPIDASIAFAGVLFIITAAAVLRLALSD